MLKTETPIADIEAQLTDVEKDIESKLSIVASITPEELEAAVTTFEQAIEEANKGLY